MNNPTWRQASSCHHNGTCVQVARHGRLIAVRDTKHPAGPTLAIAPATLRALKET